MARLVQTPANTMVLVHGSETWRILFQLKLNIRTIAMLSHRESTIAAVDQIPVVAHLQLGNNASGLQMTLNTPAHGLLISICFA